MRGEPGKHEMPPETPKPKDETFGGFFEAIPADEKAKIDAAKLGGKMQAAEEAAKLAEIRAAINPDEMVKKLDETRDDN